MQERGYTPLLPPAMDALVGTQCRCRAGLAVDLGVLCPGGPAHPAVEETLCFIPAQPCASRAGAPWGTGL